jgi:hypothetical protein
MVELSPLSALIKKLHILIMRIITNLKLSKSTSSILENNILIKGI